MKDVERWHYDMVRQFHTYHYTDVITENHLREMKVLHKKEGWYVHYNKEKWFFPLTIEGKPLRECLPLRVIKKKSFSHGTSLYYEPTYDGLQVFHIPAKQHYSFREWVDLFAPFSHTHPKQFLLYKLCILGSVCERFHFRIASNPAFGKDSLPTILRTLLPFHVGIYTPKSTAKLMTMLERRLLIVNEIPDVTQEHLNVLEPVIRCAGDMRTEFSNNALKVVGLTKDTYDIAQLSMGFLYNELEDYAPPALKKDKRDKYFDHTFTKATCERFLPLHLQGTLNIQQFDNITKKNFIHHHTILKKWVMTALHFLEVFPNKKYWKRNHTIVFEKGRVKGHYLQLLRVIEEYAETQEEFDGFCMVLRDAYVRYRNMLQKGSQGLEVYQ